ncbi:MAG TPA: AraC family transcriptional regulator [Candidatus Angelobacter sp.]|nr:AraC family transcriptional regulator [Candidatus Angelobacter sp.]
MAKETSERVDNARQSVVANPQVCATFSEVSFAKHHGHIGRGAKRRLVCFSTGDYDFGTIVVTVSQLQMDLFSQFAEPFTGETLFDRFGDLVFFIKNSRGEYVVVNQTLVTRCGLHDKNELIGRRADELFPKPLGESYREQDERVLRHGRAILDQLELHFYVSGGRGWCLTNKLPLRGHNQQVIGLVGISKDLQSASERGEDYSAIAGVVRHIQKNFADTLRVKDLAKRAGLSGYQLEQRIRKIFQFTAGQLIQKTRMEAAVQKLVETADPIARVALDCGYSDQSAFTRQFRQTIGLSPSEYRTAYGKGAT